MKKIINSTVIVSLLLLYACCQGQLLNREKLKCLKSNFSWEIIGVDSSYNEFYFDDKLILLYLDGIGGVYPTIEDSSCYYDFLKDFYNSNNIHEQSNAVSKIFLKIYKSNLKIQSIKPIGSFLYHFSNNSHENYALFCSEANDRYFKFRGYSFESEESDSISEEISIPFK